MKNFLKKSSLYLATGGLIFALGASIKPGHSAAYATLQNRSITISTSAGGATATHSLSFYFPVAVDVGSLVFEYCDDPIAEIACITPPGLDASSATLDFQDGEANFGLSSTSINTMVLGRADSIVGNQQNTYTFGNIINPSNVGPFYVRISAYSSGDGSGAPVAESSVAASITTGVNINAEVPDILYFCSAISIPTDCSDASGDFIELGTLSSRSVSTGTSQFMVGTNAPNGYSVTSNGFTMTSGSNQIASVNPASISRTGNSQFGLNLRANLSPLVGADRVGGSGSAAPAYNNPNSFFYQDGDIVAAATGPSEIELYTVSYIVNINSTQAAGIYNTTITYVCTAGF